MFDKKELNDALFYSAVNKDGLRPQAELEPERQIFEIATADMVADSSAMLRRLHGISINSVEPTLLDSTSGILMFRATGSMGTRLDTAHSAVVLTAGLSGRDLANAIKAAETNAKSRLTASLLGYGFKYEAPASSNIQLDEPESIDTPAVNQAPAAVVADARVMPPDAATRAVAYANKVIDVKNEIRVAEDLPTLPHVTEAQLSSLHKQSEVLSAQTHNPNDAAPAPKSPDPIDEQPPSFFDDEPMTAPPAAQPIMTACNATPAPVRPTATVEATASEVLDVKDVEPVAPTSDKPTRLQFQKLNERCTNLVRNVLPKSGQKDAPNLLLPYLKKKLNVPNVMDGSLFVWEETLAYLEGIADPKALYQILKGGK